MPTTRGRAGKKRRSRHRFSDIPVLTFGRQTTQAPLPVVHRNSERAALPNPLNFGQADDMSQEDSFLLEDPTGSAADNAQGDGGSNSEDEIGFDLSTAET